MPRVDAGTKKKPHRQKQSPLFGLIGPRNDEPPTWKVYAQAQARRGEICPVCYDLKVTREDVGISHENFGKLFDCPACSEGRLSSYLKQSSGLASRRIDGG